MTEGKTQYIRANRYFKYHISYIGADLGFSRGGGGGFSKKFTTFFFRSTKLIFRALPKHCFGPILWLNFPRGRQIFEKTVKRAVFWHFLKNFDKKSRFFGARSPSNLVYIGAQGAFRKILGSFGQIRISEKVSKGDRLGRQGSNS